VFSVIKGQVTTAVTSHGPTRFDLYAQMHKGLRAFMAATLVTWGRLDCDDDQADKDGLDPLTLLLDACVAHLDKENRYVRPAFKASCPGASGQITGEHLHHLASIAQFRARGDAIVALVPAAREPLCHQLYRALAVFVGENLACLQRESDRCAAKTCTFECQLDFHQQRVMVPLVVVLRVWLREARHARLLVD